MPSGITEDPKGVCSTGVQVLARAVQELQDSALRAHAALFVQRSEALAHRYMAITSSHIVPLRAEAYRLARQVETLIQENKACAADAASLISQAAELRGAQSTLRAREAALSEENVRLLEENGQLQRALAKSEVRVQTVVVGKAITLLGISGALRREF
jgi:hypothetical protein